MQTPTKRTGSSEASQKVSSRVAPRLKINSVGSGSGSPSSHTRTPNQSPKAVDRRLSRSPVSTQKKHPGRAAELESQISQLQGELKKVTDQLLLSESSKKEVQAEVEKVKSQLLVASSTFEESQKQLPELTSSKGSNAVEIQDISKKKNQAWVPQLESVQRFNPKVDSHAVASALDEIQRLKLQLDTVVESQGSQRKCRELNNVEHQNLKVNLAETLSVVESMRNELNGCNASKVQTQELVTKTLMQLEAAKGTVNSLITDGTKATETYKYITLELEQSRACVNLLEGLVRNLKADVKSENDISVECDEEVNDRNVSGNQDRAGVNLVEAELASLRSEVGRLRCALEATENRDNEDQSQNNLQTRSACEGADLIKSASNAREVELEVELKKAKADIEFLKANLMDKENELQGISEENEGLNMKIKKTTSNQREHLLENELRRLRKDIGELRAMLADKEAELQVISEENMTLKSEMNKKEEADTEGPTTRNPVVPSAGEIEAARAAEGDALMTKLGYMAEETVKSNKRAVKATEQLEAAKAAHAEMEAELRRVKVQSDQWRKAAEAAASMLAPARSDGKFVERTGSMDSGYSSPFKGRIGSPCLDEYEDDAFKKRNGNMLKKIGVLWKKPQK